MLSKQSEDFLLKLRLELVKRGKKDEEIDAIEEELRDHLYEAEYRGEDVHSVTGGSVDAYIKSISEEMPFDRSLIKTILGGFLILAMFLILPGLLRGDLDLTIPRLIYYGLILFVVPVVLVLALVKLIERFGDTKKSYVYAGTLGGLIFLGMLIAEFLIKHSDAEPVLQMTSQTSYMIGLVLTLIVLVLSIWNRIWIYVAATLIIAVPEIIAHYFADNKSSSLMISSITSIVMILISVGVMMFVARKGEQ